MRRWAVAMTVPQGEKRARRDLVDAGFKVFLPMRKIVVRHGSMRHNFEEALFPRYLFSVIGDAWNSVMNMKTISSIMSCSGKPSLIDDQIIDVIRNRCDSDGFYREELISPKFRRGDKVRLTDGAFDGCVAQFHQMLPRDRAAIWVKMFGNWMKVEARSDGLVAA